MRRVEVLDAGISASTSRYFELARTFRVKSDREATHNNSMLQEEFRLLLAAQSKQLAVFKEEVERRNKAINEQRTNHSAKAEQPTVVDNENISKKYKKRSATNLRCIWMMMQNCWRKKTQNDKN